MPRAVLLDLFDTVVASDWSAWHATLSGSSASTGARCSRPTRRPASDATPVATATRKATCASWSRPSGSTDPPPDLIRSCAAAHYDFTRNGIELYDDVVPTLAALRDAGVRTALISNCDHFARHVVDRLELRERFDAVILSYEVGAKKPSPRDLRRRPRGRRRPASRRRRVRRRPDVVLRRRARRGDRHASDRPARRRAARGRLDRRERSRRDRGPQLAPPRLIGGRRVSGSRRCRRRCTAAAPGRTRTGSRRTRSAA